MSTTRNKKLGKKLGMNRKRERGDKREKSSINLYTSHPHPLFFLSLIEFSLLIRARLHKKTRLF